MTSTSSCETVATSTAATIIETSRVVIVAGTTYGAVVAGVGSRLAMLLLRVTSPQQVIGIRSDDDFVIGWFTLAGTYNLLTLGAAVGIVGAGAYLLVESRLLGPVWFRHLTVGLACAAVVGSMLVHARGVDFTQLKPKWLAIGLFVVLPGLCGTFIGPTVDAVKRTHPRTARGRRRWLLPILAIACFPPAIPVVVFTVAVLSVLTAFGTSDSLNRARSTPAFGMFIRAAWSTIAVAGFATLVNDIGQLT